MYKDVSVFMRISVLEYGVRIVYYTIARYVLYFYIMYTCSSDSGRYVVCSLKIQGVCEGDVLNVVVMNASKVVVELHNVISIRW
jgi:hypothetical protein